MDILINLGMLALSIVVLGTIFVFIVALVRLAKSTLIDNKTGETNPYNTWFNAFFNNDAISGSNRRTSKSRTIIIFLVFIVLVIVVTGFYATN